MRELSRNSATFTAYSKVEQELTIRFNITLEIQKKLENYRI